MYDGLRDPSNGQLTSDTLLRCSQSGKIFTKVIKYASLQLKNLSRTKRLITYHNRVLESRSQTSCEVWNLCRASCLELCCARCMQDVSLSDERARKFSYHQSTAIDVTLILRIIERSNCTSRWQCMCSPRASPKTAIQKCLRHRGAVGWCSKWKRPKAKSYNG